MSKLAEHIKGSQHGEGFYFYNPVTSFVLFFLALLLFRFWVKQSFQYAAQSVEYFHTVVASGSLDV